jgi:MoCo/4Fe-4S cofactor protein with predicted Tat translocation signal
VSPIDPKQSGKAYWRGLEQLADSQQVREYLEHEFPGYDPNSMAAAPSRRRFLKLMGASLAMAGLTLTGCRRWPQERLAPYSTNPAGHMPGVPEQYATAWELGGVAQPLLVTSFDGRPIKIEGNPSHPMSWTKKGKYGSADAFAQATILDMYDPQRSREILDRSTGAAKTMTWEQFPGDARKWFGKTKDNGAGLAILCEATASPSVLDMKKRLLAAFPQAKWHEYEPLTSDVELEASRAAFGKSLRTVLHLDQANVVVSLDADLLGTHPAHVRYAADWSEKRRAADADGAGKGEMSRVYMAESRFSVTGSVADVRLAVDPSRIDVLARAIAAKLGVAGVGADQKLTDLETKFVNAAADDLNSARGASVIAAGPSAPLAVHLLAHAINQKIGAIGKTVTLIDDPAGNRTATHFAQIMSLSKDMADGKVQTLLILGGNPAYDAPLDAHFDELLPKIDASIHLSLYDDETSRKCKWHIPRAHYLEAWGDGRAWDGSANIVQPLIEPLFDGKSIIEILALVTGDELTAGELIVRRTWKNQLIKGADFEKQWRRALEAGVLANSAFPAVTTAPNAANIPAAQPAPASGTFTLKFEPDSHTYDGRFANNAWLQETHDPLTKLVWDNAALVSVQDAQQLGLTTSDVVTLEGNGYWLETAVYVMPGQPVGVISLSLGYGRSATGTPVAKEGAIGERLGFNAYRLRTSATPYVVSGVKLKKGTHDGKMQTYTLATTIVHHLIDELGMKGREARIGGKGETGIVIREATFAEYKKDPKAPNRESEEEGKLRLQLFDPPSPDRFSHPHRWGMSIDMNTCIGCNACVVACQAENNVGVVGKDMVLMHREMGWLRIDTYFKGEAADPQIDAVHQPMMCVHCENAPCEQVCPVAATMHDTEGLNVMVYNRCIGTRYCSNNCPYKVRRFNYFDWHAKPPRKSTGVTWPGLPDGQQLDEKSIDPIRRMQFNPEVTVRMRGVMEKCTYCIQRISRTKIARRNADQEIKDGDIVTACQQACPTQAIIFGNLNDKSSEVYQLHQIPRAYEVLGELNPRPRTRHLAKLRNPPEALA